MFIEFETDCWKCNEMHPEVASSPQELWDIVTGMGSWLPTIRITSIQNIGGEGPADLPANSDAVILPTINTMRKAAERLNTDV